MIRYSVPLCTALCLASPIQAEPASFASPQAALDAFMTALEAQDRPAMLEVFGAGAEDVLYADDPVENRANRAAILALYSEGYRFQPETEGVLLLLGAEAWPFPIPLVRAGEGWTFDIAAGEEEIQAREIGRNELDVVDLLEAYVDLQAAFRLVDHDGDGVMEFASQIIADPGARNGLFWPEGDGLVGAVLARAALAGWSDGADDLEPEPFLGYYFTILHGQGAGAPGGALDYMAGGNLVAGHAMLAVPAEYGVTGIHSFVVGENGIVFEADFGEDTLAQSEELTHYDPGADWTPVE